MPVIGRARMRELLPWPELVEALRKGFDGTIVSPVRHHHTVAGHGEPDKTLLLMPCWRDGGELGVKIVKVTPGNSARGLPAVAGLYVLFSGDTGAPVALLDGGELTARRTAAASALAASYLARKDARRLTVIGTGRLAPNLVEAHRAVRDYAHVTVWGRSAEKAAALAADLSARLGIEAAAEPDLEKAVRGADTVSAATLSRVPLVRGAWLTPGMHVDLVGAFTPQMRESDADALARARVFVDTRAGALKEAGDVVQAIAEGALGEGDIAADLFDLCSGRHKGRTSADEITLFKSVGASLEDLAAAELAYRLATG
ncbi:bifunctional Delta(1)-pyrroline-2-carboxylate/Delta(1)-piperideine-2-carboxylate reductase [Futiania mangrovi]